MATDEKDAVWRWKCPNCNQENFEITLEEDEKGNTIFNCPSCKNSFIGYLKTFHMEDTVDSSSQPEMKIEIEETNG